MINPIKKTYTINNKVTFAVEIAGEGEPLVYLHGAGGVAWDPFLEGLAQKYQVIVPYLPGTGESTGLEHIDGVWDLVLYYYDLFEAMGLESVNIIGHSLGGMIATELAATDQKRIKNLVVACPVGLWLDEHPIPDVLSMLPDEALEHAFADPNSPYVQAMKEKANTDDVNEKIELTIERVKNLNAAGKFLWPIPDRGLKKRIHRVKAPTLIIWGDKDRIVPPIYGEEFQKSIPQSKLVTLEDASHMVLLEKHEEAINSVLTFFEMNLAKEA
ncbi:hypothetical protein BTR23_12500 [Alkalihalophilus pseudofirmus]|nr:hypothetical protein BTR23_12500 [Alkalihalophilus pseudofirmus]